jgi:hypothetical protein
MIANAICQAIAALFDLIAVFLWIFVAASDLVSAGLVVSETNGFVQQLCI